MEGERAAGRDRSDRTVLRAVLAAAAALGHVVGALMVGGASVGGDDPSTVVAGDFAGASDATATTAPRDHGAHDDDGTETSSTSGHDEHTGTTHGPDDPHDGHETTAPGDDAHDHDTTAATSDPVVHEHATTGTTTPGHDHDPTPGTTTPGHDHTTPTTGTSGTTVPHDHDDPEPGELSPETLAEIDVAREVAMQYPTAADATAAGWQKITIHLPGIAAHYLRFAWLDGTFDLTKPEVLLYGGEGPDAPLVGVNYIVTGSSPPEGFTGDADHWHEHPTLCYNPTLGLIVGDETDTAQSCAAMGGTIISFAGNWLLHVWCIPGWEAPEGVFSHENSKVV
jgi:hypothetical protein